MTTVNLEKELLKTNEKLLTSKEILCVQESEKITNVNEEDVLNRVGLMRNIYSGRGLKHSIEREKQSVAKFDQTRIFHISQIKSVCEKYYLRFLPVQYYKGTIDPNLATKITTVEVAHGFKLNQHNCFIIAPKSSFDLKERPKDPLFFYKVSDSYYYLIHKWGNDLSIFRRLYALFSNTLFCYISVMLVLSGILLLDKVSGLIFMGFTTVIWCIFYIGDVYIADEDAGSRGIRFVKGNEWDSHYI